MKHYTLQSSPAVCAPGLIRWAINGAKFKRDRKLMIKIVADTWSLPTEAAEALLTQKVPFAEGANETVSFQF